MPRRAVLALVLFAAGNCGGTCPDGRCDSDNGEGRSIWGANGHPSVMTVGAVNTRSELIGYSSQGPATLHNEKPDFCAASHFRGYFPVDTGTSAACPIAAGVAALLKQARPEANQAQIKGALQRTARNIGPGGWDRHSGFGIVQSAAALEPLQGSPTPEPPQPQQPTVPRSGVQFSGRVNANGTNRWRTWGWPFEWHVAWTVVPVDPASSSAQIRFTVEAARATDGTVTYWVSVTNLTSSPVNIEGRYDVLGG